MISNYIKKIKKIKINPQSRIFIILIFICIFFLGFFLGKITFINKYEGDALQIPIIQNQNSTPEQINQSSGAIITTKSIEKQNQIQSLASKVESQQTINAPVAAPVAPIINQKTISVNIRANDSLEKIFKRNNIDIKSAKVILGLKQASILNNLNAGKKLSLKIEKIAKPDLTLVVLPKVNNSKDKKKNKTKKKNKIKNISQATYKLIELIYIADELNTITVTAHNNSWQVKLKHIEPTVKLSYLSAIVDKSVYSAANKKGISRKIIAQLSNMFNKKADIGKLHKGDRFALCCKDFFIGNKKIKGGEILAAEIMHDGKLQRMVRFTDPKGNTDYYTPEGYNSNPPIMRFPIVSYKNIGSRYGERRHPILGYTRMHKGVDFSASHGTPVQASCSGIVEFAGRSGGHGLMITLKKGAYSPLYAHLSKFAGHIKPGAYVKKGETIGYVGATGLATGPHLHYEVHVNGVHHDPLTVKLPEGEMIAPEYRKSFFAQAKRALAQLDMHQNNNNLVAMNDVDNKLA